MCGLNNGFKRVLVFFIVITMVFGLFTFNVFAEESVSQAIFDEPGDGIYIRDLKINEVTDEYVSGSFKVVNNSEEYFSGIDFVSKLFIEGETKSNLISETRNGFDIFSNESKDFNFKTPFLKNIPTSDYSMIISVEDRAGRVYADKLSDKFKIENESSGFLMFDSGKSYVLDGENKVGMLSGPTVSGKESISVSVYLENITDKIVEGDVEATIYRRSLGFAAKPVYSSVVGQVRIDANEWKEVKLDIPVMQEPESYLVEMCVVDRDKNPLSGKIYARYVVPGITGKLLNNMIENVDDKIIYKFTVVGPADGLSLDDAFLEVQVLDEEGKIIIEKKDTIKIGMEVVDIHFEAMTNEPGKTIKIVSKLTYKDQLLDSYEGNFVLRERFKPVGELLGNKVFKKDDKLHFSTDIRGPQNDIVLSGAVFSVFVIEGENRILVSEEIIDIGNFDTPMDVEVADYERGAEKKVGAELRYLNETLDAFEGTYKSLQEGNQDYFSDISNERYRNEINELAEMKVFEGYPDGTFKPLTSFTRAQFAKIACILADSVDLESQYREKVAFVDVDIDSWANGYINVAKEKKLMIGYPDGTFLPDREILYRELVTFMVRYLEGDNKVDETLQWPYNYIKRAGDLGILNDIEIDDYNAPANRNLVAKLVFNTLKLK